MAQSWCVFEGFKEIGFKKTKDLSADDDVDESNNMRKLRASTDGDRKPEISMLQSLFDDTGMSEERLECPFKPPVNHFGLFSEHF